MLIVMFYTFLKFKVMLSSYLSKKGVFKSQVTFGASYIKTL